jgi:ribosomal protein S18 acetylase RimI-like enzyme
MKKFNIISILSLTLFFGSIQAAGYVIENYDSSRDQAAVASIIAEHPQYLAYESIKLPFGATMPPGITIKIIEGVGSITKVLRVNDETVGFVDYQVLNPKLFGFDLCRHRGLVHLLGIKSECFGKGYGKALFDIALQDLQDQGVPRVILTVKKNNARAIAFYKKSGFVYGQVDGEDSSWYKKDLIDEVPVGNIAQRNPYSVIGLAAVAVSIGAYLYFRKK